MVAGQCHNKSFLPILRCWVRRVLADVQCRPAWFLWLLRCWCALPDAAAQAEFLRQAKEHGVLR
jgi:hypothetical protein